MNDETVRFCFKKTRSYVIFHVDYVKDYTNFFRFSPYFTAGSFYIQPTASCLLIYKLLNVKHSLNVYRFILFI